MNGERISNDELERRNNSKTDCQHCERHAIVLEPSGNHDAIHWLERQSRWRPQIKQRGGTPSGGLRRVAKSGSAIAALSYYGTLNCANDGGSAAPKAARFRGPTAAKRKVWIIGPGDDYP